MNESPPTLMKQTREAQGRILLRDIHAGDRLREVDQAWVEALANQFDSRGQEQPIVVRRVASDEGIAEPYALASSVTATLRRSCSAGTRSGPRCGTTTVSTPASPRSTRTCSGTS